MCNQHVIRTLNSLDILSIQIHIEFFPVWTTITYNMAKIKF